MVQLLAFYTDPECHNTPCYRWTDRQTDDIIMPVAGLAIFNVLTVTWYSRMLYIVAF